MRVVYIGMLGEFSRLPLLALLDAGVDVCAIVLPPAPSLTKSEHPPIKHIAPILLRSEVPLSATHNIVQIGWERGIEVYEIARAGDREVLAAFKYWQVDVACVACFPYKIPATLLLIPQHGFLNLHPTLLPNYRGPHPMFWLMRSGERSTGVTIHFMDEGWDTGDIAMQAPLELPDGISGAEADRLTSTLGARLMVETLHGLESGALSRRKQPEGGSYFATPSDDDFKLDTTWPAQRAFNFMRGTDEWGKPYPIEVDGKQMLLKSAESYSADGILDAPYVESDDEVLIQFSPGVLRARLV